MVRISSNRRRIKILIAALLTLSIALVGVWALLKSLDKPPVPDVIEHNVKNIDAEDKASKILPPPVIISSNEVDASSPKNSESDQQDSLKTEVQVILNIAEKNVSVPPADNTNMKPIGLSINHNDMLSPELNDSYKKPISERLLECKTPVLAEESNQTLLQDEDEDTSTSMADHYEASSEADNSSPDISQPLAMPTAVSELVSANIVESLKPDSNTSLFIPSEYIILNKQSSDDDENELSQLTENASSLEHVLPDLTNSFLEKQEQDQLLKAENSIADVIKNNAEKSSIESEDLFLSQELKDGDCDNQEDLTSESESTSSELVDNYDVNTKNDTQYSFSPESLKDSLRILENKSDDLFENEQSIITPLSENATSELPVDNSAIELENETQYSYLPQQRNNDIDLPENGLKIIDCGEQATVTPEKEDVASNSPKDNSESDLQYSFNPQQPNNDLDSLSNKSEDLNDDKQQDLISESECANPKVPVDNSNTNSENYLHYSFLPQQLTNDTDQVLNALERYDCGEQATVTLEQESLSSEPQKTDLNDNSESDTHYSFLPESSKESLGISPNKSEYINGDEKSIITPESEGLRSEPPKINSNDNSDSDLQFSFLPQRPNNDTDLVSNKSENIVGDEHSVITPESENVESESPVDTFAIKLENETQYSYLPQQRNNDTDLPENGLKINECGEQATVTLEKEGLKSSSPNENSESDIKYSFNPQQPNDDLDLVINKSEGLNDDKQQDLISESESVSIELPIDNSNDNLKSDLQYSFIPQQPKNDIDLGLNASESIDCSEQAIVTPEQNNANLEPLKIDLNENLDSDLHYSFNPQQPNNDIDLGLNKNGDNISEEQIIITPDPENAKSEPLINDPSVDTQSDIHYSFNPQQLNNDLDTVLNKNGDKLGEEQIIITPDPESAKSEPAINNSIVDKQSDTHYSFNPKQPNNNLDTVLNKNGDIIGDEQPIVTSEQESVKSEPPKSNATIALQDVTHHSFSPEQPNNRLDLLENKPELSSPKMIMKFMNDKIINNSKEQIFADRNKKRLRIDDFDIDYALKKLDRQNVQKKELPVERCIEKDIVAPIKIQSPLVSSVNGIILNVKENIPINDEEIPDSRKLPSIKKTLSTSERIKNYAISNGLDNLVKEESRSSILSKGIAKKKISDLTSPDIANLSRNNISENQLFKSHDSIYSKIEKTLEKDDLYMKQLCNKFKELPKQYLVKDTQGDFTEFSLLLMVYKDIFSTVRSWIDLYDLSNVGAFIGKEKLTDANIIVSINIFINSYKKSSRSGVEFDLKYIRNAFLAFTIMNNGDDKKYKKKIKFPIFSPTSSNGVYSKQAQLAEYNSATINLKSITNMNDKEIDDAMKFKFNKITLMKILLDFIVNNCFNVSGVKNENLSNLFPHIDRKNRKPHEETYTKSNQIYTYYSIRDNGKYYRCFGDIMHRCFYNTFKSRNTTTTEDEVIPDDIIVKAGSFVTLIVDRSNEGAFITDTTNDNNESDNDKTYLPFPIYSKYGDKYFVLQAAMTMSAKSPKSVAKKYDLHVVKGAKIFTYENNILTDRGCGKTLEQLQHEGVFFIYRVVDV